MNEINSFPIPPRDLRGLEPVTKPSEQRQNLPDSEAISFQENLKKALGSMSQQANEVSKTTPSYENAHEAMEAAKNAYHDSLHAHQLMQSLMHKIDASTPDRNSEE